MEERKMFDRDRWVAAALVALAKEGHTGVRADRLAKRLKVTRGSFYWHFRDVADFHDAVLAQWRVSALDMVVAQSQRAQATPAGQLDTIIATVFSRPPTLERAVQAWAGVYPPAAKVYDAVARLRLQHLTKLMREAGASEAAATGAASALYWAFLGYVQAPDLPGANGRLEALRRMVSR
jgi:AcrR family transcriptional regulator